MTFSAALAGLVMGVVSPSAFGHGNNPSFSDTAPPDTPSIPNGADIQGSSLNDKLRDVLTPGPDISVFIGADVFDALDISSRVLADRPLVDPGPGAVKALGAGPVDLGIDVFVSLPGSSAARGLGGAIPAPGTLALLGLAAAVARRRRRRQ
jgi:hypothetical protein